MILTENWESGKENYAVNDGDIERVWDVQDAASGIEARNAVFLLVPEIDEETQLVRKTISTVPKGMGFYQCSVKYSKVANKIKLTIDAGAEKLKIIKAKEEIGNHKIRDLELYAGTLNEPLNIDANVDVFDISIANVDLYNTPFEIIIDSELMRVDQLLSGFTIGVTRGFGNTVQVGHINGAVVTVLEPGPSFGGLVNVGKDKVDGVDWYTPGMKLTMQWSSKYDALDPNYVTAVSLSGGKVNNQTIALTIKEQQYLFLRGELVSLGGTFDDTSDDGVSMTLKFEVSRSDLVSVGERDGSNATWLSKVYKEGWHYGSIRTTMMTSNGIKIDVPNSFHVNRVADYLDFDVFEIFDTIGDD